MRLQRLINANSAKAESKRDIEMKREKAAREKRWVQNTFLYSSLSNNCADGTNVQAGKYPKFNKCADWNKCAGWKIS